MERLKGMEEFLLGAYLSGDKLNIVYQQHIDFAVFGSKFHGLALLNGFDQLVGHVFAFGIENLRLRIVLMNFVADGIQQVCFAQTGASVNKQGIVISGRFAGDSLRGGMGKFVGRTDYKVVERKFLCAVRTVV